MKILVPLFLLAACAQQPETPIFTPVAVDMPVTMKCKAPHINPPADLLMRLPRDASLTSFTRACAEQSLLDQGYIQQLQAIVKLCSDQN